MLEPPSQVHLRVHLGDRFLDLSVVLGTPFGVDFRPPLRSGWKPKWTLFGYVMFVRLDVFYESILGSILGLLGGSCGLGAQGGLQSFRAWAPQNLRKCFILGHFEPPRASWRPLGLRRASGGLRRPPASDFSTSATWQPQFSDTPRLIATSQPHCQDTGGRRHGGGAL